jgi:hypothetical protein
MGRKRHVRKAKERLGNRKKTSCVVRGPSRRFVHSTIALLLGAALLFRQPTFLGRARRLRGASLLGNDQGMPDKRRQPLVRRQAILPLTAMLARDHAYLSVRVEPRTQLDAKSLSLRIVDRRGAVEVPQQLDPGGRRVDVLAPRTARSCRAIRKLRARNPQPRRHVQVGRFIHTVASGSTPNIANRAPL